MMPNQPGMIGDFRLAALMFMSMRMSGMMRVNMTKCAMLAEIAVRVVRDRIAAAATNHTWLVYAFLVDSVRLPQGEINAKIGRRYGAPAQVATDRARGRISGLAHVMPVAKRAMSPAFVVVERHTSSPDV